MGKKSRSMISIFVSFLFSRISCTLRGLFSLLCFLSYELYHCDDELVGIVELDTVLLDDMPSGVIVQAEKRRLKPKSWDCQEEIFEYNLHN